MNVDGLCPLLSIIWLLEIALLELQKSLLPSCWQWSTHAVLCTSCMCCTFTSTVSCCTIIPPLHLLSCTPTAAVQGPL
jgi:hypothetical protein